MNFFKLNLFGLCSVAFFTLAGVNFGQAIFHGTGDASTEALRFLFVAGAWWTGILFWMACQEVHAQIQAERVKDVTQEIAMSLQSAFKKAKEQEQEWDS